MSIEVFNHAYLNFVVLMFFVVSLGTRLPLFYASYTAVIQNGSDQ